MKILVTGGEGFVGQHVVKELQHRGYFPDIVRHSEYDLTNKFDIYAALHRFQPDIIIHLAALVGGIGVNKSMPGTFFYKNALMAIELVEAARHIGISKFVGIGSVCSYPQFIPHPTNEYLLWEGYPEKTNAAYGLAKRMLLVQLQAYREQYNMNGIFLMPTNMYGPGDNFDLISAHVIPAMIRKMIENEKEVTFWGTGKASREFLYVKDSARGIVDAMENYDKPDPVNIAVGKTISMLDLSQLIAEELNYSGEIKWDPSYPDGDYIRSFNTKKAYEEFNFIASTPLREGIKETILWYKGTL